MDWALITLLICQFSFTDADKIVTMPSLPQGKIVFGDRVTNLSEWKFTAMFVRGNNSHAFCTGAIIDEIHILSAAHCLVYIDDEFGQKEARYCIVLYWIGLYGIVSCCFFCISLNCLVLQLCLMYGYGRNIVSCDHTIPRSNSLTKFGRTG